MFLFVLVTEESKNISKTPCYIILMNKTLYINEIFYTDEARLIAALLFIADTAMFFKA
jgi:hypothetical protein